MLTRRPKPPFELASVLQAYATRHESELVPAVVVGGADNGGGLGVVRSLGQVGIPVIVIDQDRAAPALHSRFARKVVVNALSGRAFIDGLVSLKPSAMTRPVLFLTTDEAVLEVSRYRNELEKHFRFRLPPHERLASLMQKSAFQKFAEQHGFAVPRSVSIGTGADLHLLGELRYPVIVKPSVKTDEYLGSDFGRAYRIGSIQQAEAICRRILPILPDLVVQEWVEGPDTEIYFCLQYRGSHGAVASFTGRKLSIWPRDVGTTASCIGAPEQHAELHDLTSSFFDAASFVGMGSMEFKRDARTGRFFMIEPTLARVDWQEEVATINGVNIPVAAYLSEIGAEVPPMPAATMPVIWQDTARHLKAVATHRASLRQPKATIHDAYWRLNDPHPALLRIYGLLRRNVRRGLGRLAPFGRSGKTFKKGV